MATNRVLSLPVGVYMSAAVALIVGMLATSLPAAEAPERLSGSLTDGGGVAADVFTNVAQGVAAGRANPDEGKKFPRPVIVPLPTATAGVAAPVISLNGAWKFTLTPPSNFWGNGVAPAGWSDIVVPGEAFMQGFDVKGYDKEFPYKRAMEIPADFKGKRIFLRFDAVYTYARVWVNGHFVRDHHGGFTPWTCEITDLVTPGERAWLTVGVTDAKLDAYINNMSSYAQHSLLGISRSVRLFAVPTDHLTRLQVETDFDTNYVNATLKTTCALAFQGAATATVALTLKDPQGADVALAPAALTLSPDRFEATLATPVAAPMKWDAEHPNLYTLEASVVIDGAVAQVLTKKVGFRKVELKNRQVLVNGRVVKLRGLGTMPAHPLAGRAVTPAMAEAAIRMYKQANVNYLRNACYPQGPEVYDLCDALGMYLEDDAPLVHDGFDNAPKTPDAIALATWAEQVEENRSHPSIILWEAGNESPIGTKIPKMSDYLKREDQTRPFVWPSYNTSPDPQTIFDHHYPSTETRFGGRISPTIYNEFAHVADYCVHTLKRDPNIRNYWGISVRKMWAGMYPAAGCLGGTIWAAIDDVFYYPQAPIKERIQKQSQGGEWGIIDGWRRAKPEHWLTKKAFSPVRVNDGPVALPSTGEPLRITITNWFDHADLSEVNVRWSAGRDSGTLRCPSASPGGGSGVLMISGRAWQTGEIVNLKCDWSGMTIDEYNLPVGGEIKKVFPMATGPAPRITEDATALTVVGADFNVIFSKTTGKMTSASHGGTTVIEGGPELNLAPVVLAGWSLSNLTYTTTATQAVITIAGRYDTVTVDGWRDKIVKGKDKAGKEVYHEKPVGPVGVVFVIKIDGHGLITTEFTITNPPPPNASQYGNTGYDEVGVTYLLPSAIDRINWDRKALWSAYPEDHIGRPHGTAMRAGRVPVYREEPTWPWSQDEKTFYYFGAEDKGGRGCNDFRSTKENIWFYSAQLAGSDKRVRVEADTNVAARAQVADGGRINLHVNTVLGYPSLMWGNFCPIAKISSGYSGTVKLRLTDNDACESVVATGNGVEVVK